MVARRCSACDGKKRSKSRSRAYHGKMTLDKAAMLRLLRREGAEVYDLMRAFGISISSTNAILQGRQWQGRPCPDCWRLLEPSLGGAERCEVCRQQRCNHCGGPKSPGRKSPRCAPCDRENWTRIVTSRTHCRECGEEMPETRRDVLCSDCRTAEQEIQKRYRDNRQKRCKRCNEPVPLAKSWTRNLCRPCANEHDRLRRALSRRLCGICGKELGEKVKDALCSPCRDADKAIRQRGTTQTAEELAQVIARRGKRSWDAPSSEP
jgi:hypothetical protein